MYHKLLFRCLSHIHKMFLIIILCDYNYYLSLVHVETTEERLILSSRKFESKRDCVKRISVQREYSNRAPSTVVVKLSNLNPENLIPPCVSFYTCYTTVPYWRHRHIKIKLKIRLKKKKKI